jgi:exopolysaccharide biosynthesis polyprenyl glycosylphosphotransferase
MATQVTRSATASEAVALHPAGPAEIRAPRLSFGAMEAVAFEEQERPSARVVWRESLHRRSLGAADLIAAALTVAFILRPFARHQIVLAGPVAGAVLLVLFKIAGLYDRDDLHLVHSTLDEIPLLAQLTGLFALCIGVLETVVLNRDVGVPRVGLLWLLAFSAVVVGRLASRALAYRASPPERCIVIGEPSIAERLRQKIASSHARAEVVASLSVDDSGNTEGEDWSDIVEVMRGLVANLNAHRIIIAPATSDASGTVELIRAAKAVGVRVSILPQIFEVVGSSVEFDDVDGLTVLGVRWFGLTRSSRLLKRVFDFSFAALGLFFLSPVLAAIALAIRVDSRGPVFYRQTRVGRDGQHFQIFKFRSMVPDADARKDELRTLNEAGDGLFKLTNDPRITSVGRFLRSTSLDELPQLFNVIRGEMSLVGPRPLVLDEDAQVRGLHRSRLHLTPGMTGPWQILGSRVPMQEMVGIDYLYVANWSLWLDLKLLVRTALHVARQGNV